MTGSLDLLVFGGETFSSFYFSFLLCFILCFFGFYFYCVCSDGGQ